MLVAPLLMVQSQAQNKKKREFYDYNGAAKGVGPGPTLAWPGWKQPDIPVEVDTCRRREF